MTNSEIIDIQRRVGTTPDGFWGPKSIVSCQMHLRALMPMPHPFPKQSEVSSFYGRHGDSSYTPPQKVIALPFHIYYEGDAVDKLRPHEKCADSLRKVFEHLLVVYPTELARRHAGILTYDGLYNPRMMRGGTTWSMHAWAVAIDFDAGNNGNGVSWPVSATMPLSVMECFAREGWSSAGAFWGRDAMHFQALQP